MDGWIDWLIGFVELIKMFRSFDQLQQRSPRDYKTSFVFFMLNSINVHQLLVLLNKSPTSELPARNNIKHIFSHTSCLRFEEWHSKHLLNN